MPLAEKKLIAQLRRQVKKGRGIAIGIGDDCAVLRVPPGHETLVTTDFSLEGIHFRREWHPAESVGHRCLARGLSDIAAMGGEPIAVFVSLAVPHNLPQSWVNRFSKGLLQLADKFSVSLAGGDTAQSRDGILADIVVVGSVPEGKAILRSGAKPGDGIYVSGELGGSSATLARMMDNPKRKLSPRHFPAHFFPAPRLSLGSVLREKGLASAMIDISDGLSTDLDHICKESKVGAVLQKNAIPTATISKHKHEVDLRFALDGGEDYELLFTAPHHKRIPPRIAGISITQIGQIAKGDKAFLRSDEGTFPLKPKGWEHFKSRK